MLAICDAFGRAGAGSDTADSLMQHGIHEYANADVIGNADRYLLIRAVVWCCDSIAKFRSDS